MSVSVESTMGGHMSERAVHPSADYAVATVSYLSSLHLMLLWYQYTPLPHPLACIQGPTDGPEAWGWSPSLQRHIWYLSSPPAYSLGCVGTCPVEEALDCNLALALHQGHWPFCGSLLTSSRSGPQRVVAMCWLLRNARWACVGRTEALMH